MTDITQEQFDAIYGVLDRDIDAELLAKALQSADITVKKPFKALDRPEEGRKIKAQARNGKEISGIVSHEATLGNYYALWIDKTPVYINRTKDAKEDPYDIVSWDYTPRWSYKHDHRALVPYVVLNPTKVWVASFHNEERAKEYVEEMNK